MNELVYRGDSKDTYAMSIAATWIWAPAIFVASSVAYFNGLYGFLWFLIPNVLTLFLFGYLAQKFINERYQDGFINLTDIFVKNERQKNLHSVISAILLISSTCVQFVGLHLLLKVYIPDISMVTSVVTVSIFCYLYTRFGGIKTCIITDKYKYLVMFGLSFLLLVSTFIKTDYTEITFFGIKNPDFLGISLSFGIITAIGLMSAPYVDNTFWQRVFSINRKNVFSTFLKSGFYFMLIPLFFGMIGFLSTGETNTSWEITQVFKDNMILSLCLSVTIFFALIATIDSNLCAIYSLTSKTCVREYSMELLLMISCLIVIIFQPTILQMFLIYGTIRTSIAIPTILLIYKKYDKQRLFYATLIASLVGSLGYLCMAVLNLPYGYIFTIFALLFPLFGYNVKKQIA